MPLRPAAAMPESRGERAVTPRGHRRRLRNEIAGRLRRSPIGKPRGAKELSGGRKNSSTKDSHEGWESDPWPDLSKIHDKRTVFKQEKGSQDANAVSLGPGGSAGALNQHPSPGPRLTPAGPEQGHRLAQRGGVHHGGCQR